MPKHLFIFDLDFTLWDAGGTWCDCTNPPYRRVNNDIYDRSDLHIRLYPDVLKILENLKSVDKRIAIASRTYEPAWANELLRLFDLNKYIDQKEIYPASKIKHINRIKENLNIDFSDMVFFDDEYRNIEEVNQLGVDSVFVRNGIQMGMIEAYI